MCFCALLVRLPFLIDPLIPFRRFLHSFPGVNPSFIIQSRGLHSTPTPTHFLGNPSLPSVEDASFSPYPLFWDLALSPQLLLHLSPQFLNSSFPPASLTNIFSLVLPTHPFPSNYIPTPPTPQFYSQSPSHSISRQFIHSPNASLLYPPSHP